MFSLVRFVPVDKTAFEAGITGSKVVMIRNFKNLQPLKDRGPLRVMFIHTELLMGGAETLLAEIIRGIDRDAFSPELCCLKRLAELGEVLQHEVPTHVGLFQNKYDIRVLGRLTRLLKKQRIDAVVTVGTGGDRMFWGRLAAWRAGVPVILSSLHSTGYPQVVEPMNQLLKPISDGFIGCARRHSQYLVEGEKCPAPKVFTIPNGIDIERFQPGDKAVAKRRLGLSEDVPVVGIVAALRKEKQHGLLISAMNEVFQRFPNCKLVIVGDGPERPHVERAIRNYQVADRVEMLGLRHDIPEIVQAFDVKVLASKMEANPASTLEAGAAGIPCIAPDVGSVPETIIDGQTGILYPASDTSAFRNAICHLLDHPKQARSMGDAARNMVCKRYSKMVMVHGYELLISNVYQAKMAGKQFLPKQLDELLCQYCQSQPKEMHLAAMGRG